MGAALRLLKYPFSSACASLRAAWLRPGYPRTVCSQPSACLPSSLSIHSPHPFSLFSSNCCRISCLFVPFSPPPPSFYSFVALAAMGNQAKCYRRMQGEEGRQPGKQSTWCCVWGGFANEVAGIVLGGDCSASRLGHRILCDELPLDLMATEAKGDPGAGLGCFSFHVLLGVRKRALPSAEGEADAPGELFWALPQPYHPLATQAAKATVPLCSLALAMCVCCSVVQGGWEKLGPVSVPCHNPCSDSSSRSWAG